MIALAVGNARLWKIHIPRGCSTSWDKIWGASKGWAQYWGEKETPEPLENTALTVNPVFHSWSYTGPRYGTAGKAAGLHGNPKPACISFLLLIYGVGHPTTAGGGELGITAADGLWKGIPCNAEGTETSREGRRHQGPQPGRAESSCKGTELRAKFPLPWNREIGKHSCAAKSKENTGGQTCRGVQAGKMVMVQYLTLPKQNYH